MKSDVPRTVRLQKGLSSAASRSILLWWKEDRESTLVSCYKGFNPINKGPSRNYLPKGPPPVTVITGIVISAYDFRRTQTLSP